MLELPNIPVEDKNKNSVEIVCKVAELAKIDNFLRNQIDVAHPTSKIKWLILQSYFTRKVKGKTFNCRRRKLVKFM